MPNRIIREGILSSDRVDQLSAAAEVFYRRLLSVVDDFGRFDGRMSMILAACYPLRITGKGRVTETALAALLDECRAAGLVVLYSVASKSFIEVCDFRQQVRAKSSKYPDPVPTTGACNASATQVLRKCAASAHLDGDVVVVVSEGVVGDDARASAPTEPPSGVTLETWNAWKRHRGKKLTPDALRLQTKHLGQWAAEGHNPNEIVERAVMNGWQGLHPPDKKQPQQRERADKRSRNMEILTGKTTDERTIEGTSERVGRSSVLSIAGDLREPNGDDVGGSKPPRSALGMG